MSTTKIQLPRCVGRGRGRGRGTSLVQVVLSKEGNEVLKQGDQLENLREKFADESLTEGGVQKLRGYGENFSVKSRDSGTVDENKENVELREFIKEPSKGKIEKEQFWIENQMLSLPAIPHASNEVLEEADIEIYTEQLFGINEDDPLPKTKPELASKIVEVSEGRYYVHTSGLVHLPKDVELNTRLLCIDEHDVLFMRCYDEHLPEDKKVIGSIQKLQSSMELYYSKLFNQAQTYLGKNEWIPEVGEVVVVSLKRLASRDHERCGFIMTTEYHRAFVREMLEDGVTVELIDDYGIGGVGFMDIYMILPKFTMLPPQMFRCELEDMGLVSQRHLIRTIVRDCTINDIWPDCLLNYVGTTWLGNISSNDRPLVEVKIQLKSSIRLDRFVTLKGHVFHNLQYVLTPFAHLVDGRACQVVDCNEQGFLWVKFDTDHLLERRMRYTLDQLMEPYISMITLSNLTVEKICPEDDKIRHDNNMKKIYATVVPDHHGKLYRVKIKSANADTQRVRVYCIDDHMEYEVNARTMLPLSCLYPDLAKIAPLVYKVHLHAIKSIQKDAPEVRKVLDQKVQLELVHEWPKDVFPPEVYIKMVDEKPTKKEMPLADAAYEEKPILAGYCKSFVESKVAAALNNEERVTLCNKILTLAEKLQEMEDLVQSKSVESVDDERKQKALERLGSQTFMGENYKFLWEGLTVTRGSSIKSGSGGSSVTSESTVKSVKSGSVGNDEVQ